MADNRMDQSSASMVPGMFPMQNGLGDRFDDDRRRIRAAP
jgi:hypothetical protein